MAARKKQNMYNDDSDTTMELSIFLRQKEKENERSRIKAVEAMILAEQRKRGELEKCYSTEMVQVAPNVGPQYMADGKLNFSSAERKNVQRRREEKAARIEFFLRSQKEFTGLRS